MFHDGLSERHLTIAAEDDLALVTHTEHGRGVRRTHQRMLVPSAGEGKARGQFERICGEFSQCASHLHAARLAVNLHHSKLDYK